MLHLLSLMFIKKKWYTVFIIIWASAVSYSRIYLGVHYPGDVICGALLGALIGWGVYKFLRSDKRIQIGTDSESKIWILVQFLILAARF